MQLVPALPRWLFNEEASSSDKKEDSQQQQQPPPFLSPAAHQRVQKGLPYLSFKLFGSIDVTYYHDRGVEDLFRVAPSRYVIGLRDGQIHKIDGPTIPFELADKVRRIGFVDSIEAYFEHKQSEK